MTRHLFLGAAFALLATPAFAQPAASSPAPAAAAPSPDTQPTTRAQMQAMIADRFAKMDANHDGFVTEAELSGGRNVGGNAAAMIARLDSDKDGKVSLAELSARTLAMFDRADANHDGIVTPEERQAAREAMRARMQQAPQGQ